MDLTDARRRESSRGSGQTDCVEADRTAVRGSGNPDGPVLFFGEVDGSVFAW
ncbi:DUF397 domain-containing protein [Actinosynnema sp. NPDC023794]